MISGVSSISDAYLIDTNVLLRSVEGGHPMHATAKLALQQLTSTGAVTCVTPQNLIEFWVVATRPLANNGLGLTPAQAQGEVANFKAAFQLLPESPGIYLEWERIAALYQNLGKWISDPKDNEICQEYELWGRSRFRQEIPFSEIVYVLMLTKKHLRKFIREHGLVTFSGDQVTPDELIPVELYAIQELNYLVGDFFDRALYYLVRGYEFAGDRLILRPAGTNAEVIWERIK